MRLAAVVSGDYGELGTAVYFLLGLGLPERPVVLVPAPLLASAGPLAAELDVRPYAGRAEAERILREARPDVAVLFSGYLLGVNSVMGFGETLRFLGFMRRSVPTLLTSDPFLGLVTSPFVFDFRTLPERRGETGGPAHRLRRALGNGLGAVLLYAYVTGVSFQLRGVMRVLPVPVGPRLTGRVRCFRNPHALEPFDRGCASGPGSTWIFVLSKVDFEMLALGRREAFVGELAARLLEAAAFDREVVVTGPRDLLEALAPRVAGEPRIALRSSDLGYEAYMRLLLGAEHAFFWNYFSNSVLYRVLAGRPVFYFHEGHLHHFLPALGKEGVQLFYQGWSPPTLAMDAPLQAPALARQGAEIVTQFQRIAEGFRACPTPADVLREAAGGPGKSRP